MNNKFKKLMSVGLSAISIYSVSPKCAFAAPKDWGANELSAIAKYLKSDADLFNFVSVFSKKFNFNPVPFKSETIEYSEIIKKYFQNLTTYCIYGIDNEFIPLTEEDFKNFPNVKKIIFCGDNYSFAINKLLNSQECIKNIKYDNKTDTLTFALRINDISITFKNLVGHMLKGSNNELSKNEIVDGYHKIANTINSKYPNTLSTESIVVPNTLKLIKDKNSKDCNNTIIYNNREYAGFDTLQQCHPELFGLPIYSLTFEDDKTEIDNDYTSTSDKRKITLIKLPEKLETIGANTFEFFRLVESIKFPDTLTFIGKKAFHACISLDNIEFPNKLQSIDDDAFMDCFSLRSVKLPNSLKDLGEAAFANCISLKSVELSDALEYIDQETFAGCTNLESIKLPKNLKNIDKSAFAGCEKLNLIEYNGETYTSNDQLRSIDQLRSTHPELF